MNKIKILQVSPNYWPAFQFGGPVFSSHNLNKALVRNGFEISVYTTCAGLEDKVIINKEVDVDGVKVTYFPFVKYLEFIGSTGWHFSPALKKAIEKNINSFDLVHIVGFWKYPVTIAGYLCRKFSKTYVISSLGMLSPYALKRKFWKKSLMLHLGVGKNLRQSAAIRYCSEYEAEECHSFLKLSNPKIIIPNGIDPAEFSSLPIKSKLTEKYPVLKGKKVVLFLGRLNAIKGLDILLKAFQSIVNDKDDTHLLIVGNDESGYIQRVRRWIKDYDLSGKVTLTGFLEQEGKLEAFYGSDLFVFPSYCESFGMSAIEAMACGLPVIMSNKVGIYKEVQKNNAGLIIEANSESLYKSVSRLLDDEALRKEISRNGKKLVNDYFDINKVALLAATNFKNILGLKS